MDARVSGEKHHFYATGKSGLSRMGKQSLEWDLNDWRWDGDLFLATPLNPAPSDCRNKQLFRATGETFNSSSSASEESDFGLVVKENGHQSEKRRRNGEAEETDLFDGASSLTLKLGGHDYPIVEADLANWEEKNGKRLKSQGSNPNRSICQVEGCGADLSGCKDYHRRHKVCETHAKASSAMVGNVMQRFCQQCSRFHLLQEFDEGKRSCRRRLAGHNRRRRKTLPIAPVAGSLIDNQTSTYLLISLLRILSNLHSNSSEQSKNQEILSHLLQNLAGFAGSCDARKLTGLLQASQDLQDDQRSAEAPLEAAELLPNSIPVQDSSRPLCSTSKMTPTAFVQNRSPELTNNSMCDATETVVMASKSIREASLLGTPQGFPSRRAACITPVDADSSKVESLYSLQHELPGEPANARVRLKNFDLNNTYDDAQGFFEGCEKSHSSANLGTSWAVLDSHQSSPPQTSGNSDSRSSQSLSSSNGDAQSRTDKLVFKLFGKDPNDFPIILRAQILEWLSQTPTDIESYIRPGCIILTIYLRLTESSWEELSGDLITSLNRLLSASGDDFWRRGWVYAVVQHHAAFIFNGQVMLGTPLLHRSPNHCRILCVTPIAVSLSTSVSFTVKGFNLAQSTMRLLCAFEGKYLFEETTQSLVKGTDIGEEHEELQCLSFSCSIPSASGRGFIEVEDNCLSSGFFPFIVAEEDVCSEIRMLESAINVGSSKESSQESMDSTHDRKVALDFLDEMGWLLRSHLRSINGQKNSYADAFSQTRFRWLIAYAMDREWCAVIRKLLDVLFQGTVDVGGCSPVELALSEYLLHSAVRKKSKSMVELLLRYKPHAGAVGMGPSSFLFKPDSIGPSNITPLHIAATCIGSESILDALTNDPGLLGIKAWKNARDSTGFTPEDYARSLGRESYLHLIQKKIDSQPDNGHVVLDVLSSLGTPNATLKQLNGPISGKLAGFDISKSKLSPAKQLSCKLCDQQLVHRSYGSRSLLYRPAMLSLVGIAAVCVCVGLLLKGPPEVLFAHNPFRWESLGYGTI